MLTQRKRKCERCGAQSNTTRTFPANSKAFHQHLWIDSLGLDKAESQRELEGIRARLAEKKIDIRWCERHFDSGGMPIKDAVDPVEDSASSEIGEKRRRTDQEAVGPVDEGNEGEAFEGIEHNRTGEDYWEDMGLGDNDQYPLREHPVDHDQSFPVAPLSVSPMKIDPQPPAIRRFDSTVSTVPTLARSDSSYRPPTIQSQSSESEGEDEEQEESVHSDYFITAMANLSALFRRCQECGALIDPTSLDWVQVASALFATYRCTGCKRNFRWESQPKKGGGHSKVFELNQSLPVAAFITGTPIPRILDLCKLLGIAINSDRSMRDYVRFYACPAIDRTYARWEKEARDLSKEIAPEEGIVVSLDGQYSKPGHNAPSCKVAAFDAHLGLIIGAVSLSVNEPEIDGISCRMESHGTERVLVDLIEDGFNIRTRVTDSNSMVDKRIRENDKLKHIESMRDFWHVQKPLRKALWAGMKRADCPLLAVWYKDIMNHLYWANQNFPKKEDRLRALEVVRSFILHCTGTHKWQKDNDFTIVTKCNHSLTRASRTKKGKGKADKKGGWARLSMSRSLLFSPHFAKSFLACSPEVGTAMCESFHSLSLMYQPKRFYSTPPYFDKKTKLSIMHNNSLVYGVMMGERVEIGQALLRRPGRVALSVKRKMDTGEHPWRMEILEECWLLRDEYEGNRFLKRIGAPEDGHFDLLKAEYDRMVLGEDSDEDEWESDYSDQL